MPLPNVTKFCGADTDDGTPCENPAMENGRCRKHGGATPSGVASSRFKHGRYSKHLPTRLIDRYEETLADGQLTSLKDEIALVDLRIADTIEGLDTGESGELWMALGMAARALRDITREANNEKHEKKRESLRIDREDAIDNLLLLIDQGVQEQFTWSAIFSLFERRKSLALAETRREVALKLMVPASEVFTMRAALEAMIQTHVPEPDRRRAFVADLDRLFKRSEAEH